MKQATPYFKHDTKYLVVCCICILEENSRNQIVKQLPKMADFPRFELTSNNQIMFQVECNDWIYQMAMLIHGKVAFNYWQYGHVLELFQCFVTKLAKGTAAD